MLNMLYMLNFISEWTNWRCGPPPWKLFITTHTCVLLKQRYTEWERRAKIYSEIIRNVSSQKPYETQSWNSLSVLLKFGKLLGFFWKGYIEFSSLALSLHVWGRVGREGGFFSFFHFLVALSIYIFHYPHIIIWCRSVVKCLLGNNASILGVVIEFPSC